MIICYKGEDLKVQETCSTYDNISVVLFKGKNEYITIERMKLSAAMNACQKQKQFEILMVL